MNKMTISLLFIIVVLSHAVAADALDDSTSVAYFDEILQQCDEQLNEWQKRWKSEVGLAFLVFSLGTVSAAIQNFTWKAIKLITVICGLVITVTTGFVNMVGWDDYRTLEKSIAKVESIVTKMKSVKSNYKIADTPNKRTLLNTFGQLDADFRKIQETALDSVTRVDNFEYSLITNAYANDVPYWVAKTPEDAQNLYFIGVANDSNLEIAQTRSKEDAIQNATRFLANSLNVNGGNPLDINKLVDNLVSAAEKADSYMRFDEQTKTYRYYSLLRINKSLAEAGIKLFAVQRGINAPAGVIKALGNSQNPR